MNSSFSTPTWVASQSQRDLGMDLGFRYSQPTLGLFVWGFIYPGWLVPRDPGLWVEIPVGFAAKVFVMSE